MAVLFQYKPLALVIQLLLSLHFMNFLSLRQIQKRYGDYTASDNIDIEIPKGKIFGLLGPNGAGKTTLIRMITRIIYPDSGQILFNGEPISDAHTERIGYMPEERGLYKKMKVGEHLVYLCRLKGFTKADAKAKVDFWLKRFEAENWYNKNVEELSKGMSQKVQFIATIIHNPDLLILDEPFSGLDPINSKLIEEEIYQLKKEGKTIIFSTHRMEQVEEICDEIVLVNKGKKVLEGGVKELKQRFKENKYRLTYNGSLPDWVEEKYNITMKGEGESEIAFDAQHPKKEMLQSLLNAGIDITGFNEILPGINEIFIRTVEGAKV